MQNILRIMGDTHGDYAWYREHIVAANLQGIHTFHVGDFGIGFPYQKRWDDYWLNDPDNLSSMNKVIGGNHDNPLYAQNCPMFLNRYGEKDGLFWTHGAASIDKEWRKPGVSWWEREELTQYEMELCEGEYTRAKPDVMITHDGPKDALRCMFPFQMMNPDIPPSRTQTFLQYLFEIHRPKYWFFGHWHHTLRVEFEGCIFQCIGVRDWVDFDMNSKEIR